MVEEKEVWRTINEGNLARSWEQRLKPREEPRVQRRRRRMLAPWVRPVLWIGGLWTAALIPAALAIHVMTMSYHYDQMNQNYAALSRQNQSLSAQLASKTTASALAAAAARLKVRVQAPDLTAAAAPSTKLAGVAAAPAVSPVQHVTSWIRHLSHSLIR